ncbi:MAG: hypothetical protein AAGJ73_08145 [Pseudomonadota bacterium]
MPKSTYQFEVIDRSGKLVRRTTQMCDNISASERTRSLLKATPGAAVVYGVEKHGHSVFSAYRR